MALTPTADAAALTAPDGPIHCKLVVEGWQPGTKSLATILRNQLVKSFPYSHGARAAWCRTFF